MRKCRECGLEIKFERVGTKWWPLNLDGTGHWELCKKTARAQQRPAGHRPGRTRTSLTHFWIGPEPPWSESLGEYRDFTEVEKVAREVCAP